MNPVFSVLVGGILPFGAVFIELFFILTSMWLHQFYYLFGFLCLVFVILVITCAEITIVLCYFQLCSEDYHWWCGPRAPCALFSLASGAQRHRPHMPGQHGPDQVEVGSQGCGCELTHSRKMPASLEYIHLTAVRSAFHKC